MWASRRAVASVAAVLIALAPAVAANPPMPVGIMSPLLDPHTGALLYTLEWTRPVVMAATPGPGHLNGTVDTVARTVQLQWDAGNGSVAYHVYRNAALVAIVSTPSFVDALLPFATYFVTQEDSSGTQSSPSNLLITSGPSTIQCPILAVGIEPNHFPYVFPGIDWQCMPPVVHLMTSFRYPFIDMAGPSL